MNAAEVDLDRLVRSATARLGRAGVPSPRTDAELLTAHVLGLTRGELTAALLRGAVLDDVTRRRWADLIEQRAGRVPLQHLTGRAGFRRLDLAVGPGVFVPRPETEVLVEAAVAELGAGVSRAEPSPLVVDLCTGSAAIALAVADEDPRVEVVALELDPAALRWAERNVAALPAGERIRLVQGSVVGAARGEGVLADLAGRVHLVVANPPYIPAAAVPVDPEVADHDPRLALYGGGADGLDLPAAVIETAAALLRPGGLLLMEHADVQGPATRALVAVGWEEVRTLTDLSGRERVLRARRGGAG